MKQDQISVDGNTRKFAAGETYWCIRPPDESLYGDFVRPGEPWLGKLSIETRLGEPFYQLHHFNAETGKIDDDSNATSMIRRPESQLFDSEEAASRAYCHRMAHHLQSLLSEHKECLALLQRYLPQDP